MAFSSLVQHPEVPDPQNFKLCSIVLQRAVIKFDNGVETLSFRSYFHSASPENYVNFYPSNALQVRFRSSEIWFPLELTEVIDAPEAFVVLDVLTRNKLEYKSLPEPFKAKRIGNVKIQGQEYDMTRLSARLGKGKKWPDLRIPVR